MTLALAVAALVAAGAFLVSRRGVVRLVLGFLLLGHAANLLVLAVAGTRRWYLPTWQWSRRPTRCRRPSCSRQS